VLERFIHDAEFPVLSANIRRSDGGEQYPGFVIRTVRGVRIGILGLTTVGIATWERPDHIRGLRFDDAVETARRYVGRLQAEGATVLVGLVHAGPHLEPVDPDRPGAWDTDYRDWRPVGGAENVKRNFVVPLAERVPELDVIVCGHSHTAIPQATINGVLVTQPGYWGKGLSRALLTVDPESGRVIEKRAEVLSVADVQPDRAFTAVAAPFHDAALDYVTAPLGTAVDTFAGGFEARRRDGALADFINAVQLHMAGAAGQRAQVSATAVFTDEGRLSAGPVRMSDVYDIYPYNNTLQVIEINGDILRRAIEHSASYWTRYDPATGEDVGLDDLVQPHARPYHWDMFTGVDYAIDLSQPAGSRVVKLERDGQPVKPDDTLLIALNNYRAGGGGGYRMYSEGTLVWESMTGIRDSLAERISVLETIDPDDFFEKNWELLPRELSR
jgi:2',3'-cyclic-nucleotide 2'-phosphodiesterase/3'-nucleotidase